MLFNVLGNVPFDTIPVAEISLRWNFYGEFSKKPAPVVPRKGKCREIPPKIANFANFGKIATCILLLYRNFRKVLILYTTTRREKWCAFTSSNYRFRHPEAKLYLDRRQIDPFRGLRKSPAWRGNKFSFPTTRAGGGFVSNKKANGKTKPPHANQTKA